MPDLLEILFGRTGGDTIRDVLYDEQILYSFGRLTNVADLPQVPEEDLPVGERYVSVTLHAQRLMYGRKLATGYYPAVRCFATVKRFIAEPVEFSRITTPVELEAIDKASLGKVIFGDQPLLGPVAYWGPLKLTLALHAVPDSDLVAPYLALLTDISGKLGGAWLTTAASLAEPIKRGIYAITGTGKETLEVGYVTGDLQPRSGYFAAVAQERLDVSQCRLSQGRLYDSSGSEIRAAFFVFSVKGTTEIKDWWSQVPGLQEAYSRSLATRTREALDQIAAECRALVSNSDDLTLTDRRSARAALAAKFEERRDEMPGPIRGAPKLDDEARRDSQRSEFGDMDAARDELAGLRITDFR